MPCSLQQFRKKKNSLLNINKGNTRGRQENVCNALPLRAVLRGCSV